VRNRPGVGQPNSYENREVWLHKVNTQQDEDVFVFEPEQQIVSAVVPRVTNDGRWDFFLPSRDKILSTKRYLPSALISFVMHVCGAACVLVLHSQGGFLCGGVQPWEHVDAYRGGAG
jgi:hypothetical protein